MRTAILCVLVFGLICSFTSSAQETPPEQIGATEQDIEARTEAISKTLRCVVCQNQSIYDSNAPLAEDMRRFVRTRVELGDSDDEVRDSLRELYGDYVLMTPPWQLNTFLLWIVPGLLVVFGGAWFITRMRSTDVVESVALTDTDRARVAEALATKDPNP